MNTEPTAPPDNLPLSRLLPLHAVVVTLRLLEDIAPAYFHQPALGAFLRHMAGSPEGFERCIRIDALESGRIGYRAGDYYRFTVVCLSGGEDILQTMLHTLARLPGSSPNTDPRIPFRNNCVLATLQDAFTAQTVTGFDELSAYDFDMLRQEADLWLGFAGLSWQFLSPARLLKHKDQRGEARGEARYCRNWGDVDAHLISARLFDSLSELLRARGVASSPRQPAPPVELTDAHVFWVDAAYTDANAFVHPMGGINGRLQLAFPKPPPVDWLQQAILGQYTGIGQRTSFGFGRYRLESPDGGFSYRLSVPASTQLMWASDDGKLAEASRLVHSGKQSAQMPDTVVARPCPGLQQSPGSSTLPENGDNLAKIGEMGDLGQLLCVTGEHATLSTHAGRLRVERDEQTLHELPWHSLQAVILFGGHSLTTPAMLAALQEGVPVHFAGAGGGYRGVLWTGQPAEPGCGLWLKQAKLFADPALCLVLAKEIVAARIRHLRETLRLRGATDAVERLKTRLEELDHTDGLDTLNGIEGAATKELFQAMVTLLPQEWGFTGRNRQPPRDPANALLSFGYTLLHGYVETLLHADGLLPWLGFYHQPHGRHATLASDLMEPFRHVVERTVLSAIQRHEIKPQDFFNDDNGACLMQNEVRRHYLAQLLERFNTPQTAYGEETAINPVQHIHRQNQSLTAWLMRGEEFHAFRTR